jgi:hypothetical protein
MPASNCDMMCRVARWKPSTSAAASCPEPNFAAANLTPLTKLYADSKQRTAEDLQNLSREQIKKLSDAAKSDLSPLIASLNNELVKQPAVQAARAGLERLDDFAKHALGLTDQLASITLDIRESVTKFAKDPGQQAQLLANVAEALEKGAPSFDPRVANPQPLPGEQELHMEYQARHQYFVLAPWNLVSFRVTQSPGTSPGWENLLPAIDVIGYRFQWAKSRFADFRIAAGVYMPKDTLPVANETGQTVSKDFYNFATELNFGFGGLRLGVGVLLTDNIGTNGLKFEDRFRILLGADLIKLITGRNLEAL